MNFWTGAQCFGTPGGRTISGSDDGDAVELRSSESGGRGTAEGTPLESVGRGAAEGIISASAGGGTVEVITLGSNEVSVVGGLVEGLKKGIVTVSSTTLSVVGCEVEVCGTSLKFFL